MNTEQEYQMSEYDGQVISDCLEGKPHAWENFVDRFCSLVAHTVDHTTKTRGIQIDRDLRDELIQDVFVSLHENQFQAVKQFQNQCEFSTYLTVFARRVVVGSLVKRADLEFCEPDPAPWESFHQPSVLSLEDHQESMEQTEADEPEVEVGRQMIQMLAAMSPAEQKIVRLYYTQNMTNSQIASELNVSVEQVDSVILLATNGTKQLLANQQTQTRRAA